MRLLKTIAYRTIKKINIDVFNNHLLVSLEGSILSQCVLNIHLLNTLNKLAPIRKFKVSYHPQTPWFSSELGYMKRKLRRFEKRFRKTKSKIYYGQFVEFRIIYRNALHSVH